MSVGRLPSVCLWSAEARAHGGEVSKGSFASCAQASAHNPILHPSALTLGTAPLAACPACNLRGQTTGRTLLPACLPLPQSAADKNANAAKGAGGADSGAGYQWGDAGSGFGDDE